MRDAVCEGRYVDGEEGEEYRREGLVDISSVRFERLWEGSTNMSRYLRFMSVMVVQHPNSRRIEGGVVY